MHHNKTIYFIFPYHSFNQGENIEESDVMEESDEEPNAELHVVIQHLDENHINLNGDTILLKDVTQLTPGVIEQLLSIYEQADAIFLARIEDAIKSKSRYDIIYEDPINSILFDRILILLKNNDTLLRDNDIFTLSHTFNLTRSDGTVKELNLPSTGTELGQWNVETFMTTVLT